MYYEDNPVSEISAGNETQTHGRTARHGDDNIPRHDVTLDKNEYQIMFLFFPCRLVENLTKKVSKSTLSNKKGLISNNIICHTTYGNHYYIPVIADFM